ncbi:MAG: methionine--tRNA ligase [Salibacteraceae bacterium]
MNKAKRHLITAALPYANGPIHIGHVAGAYLTADIYARLLRKKLGEERVLFVCGSDEHGAAISMKAIKEKRTPQEIVDKYHHLNKKAFEQFGISFDIYDRTSSELHHKTSQEFFLRLYDEGVFQRVESEQMFDPEANQFLADRFVTGTCPNCGNERAYGDQCERCGKSLSPSELIHPRSTLSGAKPEMRKTWHFYLPLNEYTDWISDFIRKGEDDGKPHHDPSRWKKHVIGQCLSWIEGGLAPRAMTRDLDWGVPVPLEDAGGKVLYVWLDAPIGYISATKQWAINKNKPDNWLEWWQNTETELVHFIGKDNIVFHCIIFPILLKAHGNFILPTNVPANEFLNLEGEKISTSRNHAVWLHEYLEDFPGRRDELRYVLTSIAPETKDSEFTWDDFQARVNNELVAILGNFINRVVVLTNKYYNGTVPSREADVETADVCLHHLHRSEDYIMQFKFREALQEAMSIARYGNKYLADLEPWKLQKDNPEEVEKIMFNALTISAYLAEAIDPFLPDTAIKIREMLAIETPFTSFTEGHKINKPVLLFSKVEDADVERQKQKLQASKQEQQNEKNPMDVTEHQISFDDFKKLVIKVGTITEAKRVENTDKLMQLTVDMGAETRTIVSGIAAYFEPKDVVGRQVCVVCNLAPRKIRGVESKGMILMAEDADGSLRFVSPDAPVSNGAVVR